MKIIIDTRWIRSLKIDGIGNFTLNITRELLNTDKQNIYVLLVESPEIAGYLKQFISADIEKYFYWVGCPVSSLQNLVIMPEIISTIKPDIFFSPCYPFFSPVVKQCRHIGVVHDLIPLIFPEMFSKAGFKFRLFYCNRFFQRLSLNYLEQVVTVSNSTKKDLTGYLGLAPEKIKVIVEGSNLAEIVFEDLKTPSEIRKDYFLFVGRHENYKNIRTLINIYHQLPSEIKNKHLLVIIGKFSRQLTPELQELVKELAEESKIFFIDSVMPESLPAYYKNAKLLIHLSLYEGFGLTLVEAMSLGLPVIASDRSSIPEVVGNAGLLVNPDDPRQIIDSIIKITEDDGLYKELAENGRQRAKYFTWQEGAKQLLKIFH